MKKHLRLLPIIFVVVISGFLTVQAKAADWAFVIFETTVTKQGVETSDANPEERRFYISNVVDFNETDGFVFRNAAKEADEYFIATVVEPLKAKGILHQYYDDGIRINNKVVYELNSRADVDELHEKTLQDLKGQSANVFTFNWTRGGNINGLETSRPTLFYRDAEKPLYGADLMVFSNSTTTVEPTRKRLRKN